MKFDFRRFLTERLGKPHDVLVLFSQYGFTPPSLGTVEKWFSRSSVPSGLFALMLALLELERGLPVSLASYIVPGEVNA